MTSLYDTSALKALAIAGGATAAVLSLLAIKYPDRAVFDELREGVPNVPGVPLLGNLPKMLSRTDDINDWTTETFEQANALTCTASSLGLPFAIQTIDPRNVEHFLRVNFENYVKGPHFSKSTIDLLGHGIFNANGEQWRYQRKTASHIFNVKNFRDSFTDVFINELQIMEKHILDEAAVTADPVDLHDLFYRFTLDSFVLLGFGVNIHAMTRKDKVPFAVAFDECQRDSFVRFIDPFYSFNKLMSKIFTPWRMTADDHLKVLNSFAADVIATRRKELAEGKSYGDLLSRFMNTRNETGEPLNDQELRDTIINILIAGRDTTAQALSWTFYNLMLHPRIESKLLEEINTHIVDGIESDAPALYEVIKKMPYAHAVFYEVLRLHPPVPTNQKYALDDDVWPDGTIIRKGDYVLWSTYSAGRSEAIWGSDAKLFKPERWLTEDGTLQKRSQGEWPVFHVGPRVCLGQNLATLEALVAIVLLLKKYKFSLIPGQKITYDASLTLPMKYGLKASVERRS
ncbi:cytochrome P450 [Radiomyces spectabilis]|uniref:cytochrome P450 n=1 Tax=Radiomyces spectabilis TaxID=64574 RepID=UPI00221FA20B|nr:cytochrome P450 [Radiomyces spectabilis]KAI8376493.1 cytochrome P450 [Radiomyces spectabilis]